MQNQKGNANIIVSIIIVILVIGLIVYAFIYKNKNKEVVEEIQQIQTEEPEVKLKDENVKKIINVENKNMETNKKVLNNFTPVTSTASLEKIDLVIGTGEEVKSGAVVSVHYTGAIASTGEIFQSSKDFGPNPVTFPLDGVIKGWTDGIPGMKVGGTRRLIIPSVQAYGTTPPPGSGIPANADLVFDVELVAVKQ